MNIQKIEKWRCDLDAMTCANTGATSEPEHWFGLNLQQDEQNRVLIEIHDEPDESGEDFIVLFEVDSKYHIYGKDFNSLLPFFEKKIKKA